MRSHRSPRADCWSSSPRCLSRKRATKSSTNPSGGFSCRFRRIWAIQKVFATLSSKRLRNSGVSMPWSTTRVLLLVNGQISRNQFAQYMEAMKARKPSSVEFIGDTDADGVGEWLISETLGCWNRGCAYWLRGDRRGEVEARISCIGIRHCPRHPAVRRTWSHRPMDWLRAPGIGIRSTSPRRLPPRTLGTSAHARQQHGESLCSTSPDVCASDEIDRVRRRLGTGGHGRASRQIAVPMTPPPLRPRATPETR